jgi:hypothetical protein
MTKKSGASGVMRRIGEADSNASGSSAQRRCITFGAKNSSRIRCALRSPVEPARS